MRRNQTLASLLPLVLYITFSACGTSRYYFRPVEKAMAESLRGFPAAEYEVSMGPERWGEVRIWSEGAELRKQNGPEQDGIERGVVIIGFEIENNSGVPLELDVAETRLRVNRAGASEAVDCNADKPSADVRAAPHEVHRTRLDFSLPKGVQPKDVESFRVRWVVSGPGQKRYEQHTAFVRLESTYAPYHWHHPWRYGYGYGFWFGPYCW